MNYTTAIFLVNRDVRAVLVTYEADEVGKPPTAPRELFKTFDQSIAVDDLVVVPTATRHLMTVVKVVEVDVEVDFDSNKEAKLIICKTDRSDYDRLLKLEAAAIQAIKSAEVRKRREELAEKLLADMDPDAAARLKALSAGDAVAIEAPKASS